MDAKLLESKLSTFFDTLLTLHPDSPRADFDRLGPYLSEDVIACTVSMREHRTPYKGRANAIKGFKDAIDKCHIVKRRVLSQSVDVHNRKVFCEMKNKLKVAGIDLDPFYETAAVEFNEHGEIKDWKMYRCLSPVAAINQKFKAGYQFYVNVSAFDHSFSVLQCLLIQTAG